MSGMGFRREVSWAVAAIILASPGASVAGFGSFDSSGTGDPVCLDYWFDGNHFTFTGGASKPDGAGGYNAEYHFTAWIWRGKPVQCTGSTLAEHAEATIVGTWDQPSKTAREVITYGKAYFLDGHNAPIARSESVVTCAKDPWPNLTYTECTIVSTSNTSPESQHFYPVSAFRISKDQKGILATEAAPSSGDSFKLPPAPAAPVMVKAPGGAGQAIDAKLGQAAAVVPDVCATYGPGAIPALKAGAVVTVPMKLTNCGKKGWNNGRSQALNGVVLEYHWALGATALPQDDVGTAVPTIARGEIGTMNAKLKAPAKAGAYTLSWELRQTPGGWFSAKGSPASKPQAVTVK